jgi:tRNA threonylcarbamoyladenosine biosynthesis protein TsaB
MSTILSIETSGNTCSVAVSKDYKLLSEQNIFMFNKHDKLLAEMVRRVLSDIDISINQLDAVAVSSGPGSFTGLRIGAAVAKGICYNDAPRLIAVPTLYAIANYNIEQIDLTAYKSVTAIIPSHKRLIYSQKFDTTANILEDIKITETENYKIDDSTFLAGPGKEKLSLPVNQMLDLPKASHIAMSAHKLYDEKRFVSAEEFSPDYVQEFIPK